MEVEKQDLVIKEIKPKRKISYFAWATFVLGIVIIFLSAGIIGLNEYESNLVSDYVSFIKESSAKDLNVCQESLVGASVQINTCNSYLQAIVDLNFPYFVVELPMKSSQFKGVRIINGDKAFDLDTALMEVLVKEYGVEK